MAAGRIKKDVQTGCLLLGLEVPVRGFTPSGLITAVGIDKAHLVASEIDHVEPLGHVAAGVDFEGPEDGAGRSVQRGNLPVVALDGNEGILTAADD